MARKILFDRLYIGDAVKLLRRVTAGSIDLTITSPPYDDLRLYDGYNFDFEATARELYRVTKKGGVVVWIVNDMRKDGGKSGTSFKQALYFLACNFKLHDVMIWHKTNVLGSFKYTYYPAFDYMFVLSKGRVKTFNPIIDRENKYRKPAVKRVRQKDGNYLFNSSPDNPKKFGKRFNIWKIRHSTYETTKDMEAYNHPAIFPERLAEDHILSWSSENDVVLDPFIGSGTVAKMAAINNRRFLGFDISKDYILLARQRLLKYIKKRHHGGTEISPC